MNFRYFGLVLFGTILILSFSIRDAYADHTWLHNIEENIVSTVAIITAVSTAIGLIFSHYATARQIKHESDAKFLDLTHRITNELVKKFDEGFEIQDDDKEKEKEGCVNWAFKYVDSLDEVAYVKKENAIPTKLTDYFGPGWFGTAKSLMIWHDDVVTRMYPFNEYRSAIETWPHVYEHCFKLNNNIKPIPPKEFPPVLLNHFYLSFNRIKNLSREKEISFKKDQDRDFSITHRDPVE